MKYQILRTRSALLVVHNTSTSMSNSKVGQLVSTVSLPSRREGVARTLDSDLHLLTYLGR